jgi:hypothetical protein
MGAHGQPGAQELAGRSAPRDGRGASATQPGMVDRRIAKATNMSHVTVGKMRATPTGQVTSCPEPSRPHRMKDLYRAPSPAPSQTRASAGWSRPQGTGHETIEPVQASPKNGSRPVPSADAVGAVRVLSGDDAADAPKRASYRCHGSRRAGRCASRAGIAGQRVRSPGG